MIDKIKRFKDNPVHIPDFGLWNKDKIKLNAFRDNYGSKRIGKYLMYLLDGFNDSKDVNEIVKKANSRYVDSWGEENIYKTTDIKF